MQDFIFMKTGYVIMFLYILIPCIENCMVNCQIMTFNEKIWYHNYIIYY